MSPPMYPLIDNFHISIFFSPFYYRQHAFNKMCSRGLNHAVCSIFSEWIPLTYGFTSSFRERECEIANYCEIQAKVGHFYLDTFEKFIKTSIFKKNVKCEIWVSGKVFSRIDAESVSFSPHALIFNFCLNIVQRDVRRLLDVKGCARDALHVAE